MIRHFTMKDVSVPVQSILANISRINELKMHPNFS